MKTPWIEAGLQAGQHFLDHFVQNIQNPPVYGDVQKYNQSFQEHLSPGDETNAATLPVAGKQYHEIGPNGEVGPVSDTPYPYNPPQQRPQPYQDQVAQVQQPNPAFNALGGQGVANAAGQAMSQIGEGVGHIIHGFSNPNLQGSQEAAQGFQGMVGGAEGTLMSPITGSLEALPEAIKNPIKQGTDAGMTLVAKSFLKYLMPQASEQALNNPDVINPMKLALQTTLMAAAAHDQGFRDRATDQINQPQDNKASLDKFRNQVPGADETSNQLSPKQMANQLRAKKIMGVNEGTGISPTNDIQTNPDQIPQPEDTSRMTYLKRNKELPATGGTMFGKQVENNPPENPILVEPGDTKAILIKKLVNAKPRWEDSTWDDPFYYKNATKTELLDHINNYNNYGHLWDSTAPAAGMTNKLIDIAQNNGIKVFDESKAFGPMTNEAGQWFDELKAKIEQEVPEANNLSKLSNAQVNKIFNIADAFWKSKK